MENIIEYFRSHGGYARMKELKKASFQTRIFASTLPDFCTSALFYTQSFERNVDNGEQ